MSTGMLEPHRHSFGPHGQGACPTCGLTFDRLERVSRAAAICRRELDPLTIKERATVLAYLNASETS